MANESLLKEGYSGPEEPFYFALIFVKVTFYKLTFFSNLHLRTSMFLILHVFKLAFCQLCIFTVCKFAKSQCWEMQVYKNENTKWNGPSGPPYMVNVSVHEQLPDSYHF